ncbi:hypothetical protein MSKU3_1569 [Komagataeibacter oboediens]|nr:hypothetical protein MSKU3_1569 [Komagataeibacter oboediens]
MRLSPVPEFTTETRNKVMVNAENLSVDQPVGDLCIVEILCSYLTTHTSDRILRSAAFEFVSQFPTACGKAGTPHPPSRRTSTCNKAHQYER